MNLLGNASVYFFMFSLLTNNWRFINCRRKMTLLIRQNIAGWCQQTFCFKKVVDNTQLLHLKQTFQPIIWIFTEAEGDGIESRLLFKKISTLNKKKQCAKSVGKEKVKRPLRFVWLTFQVDDWLNNYGRQTAASYESGTGVEKQSCLINMMLF